VLFEGASDAAPVTPYLTRPERYVASLAELRRRIPAPL
jgi:hypothetical protein